MHIKINNLPLLNNYKNYLKNNHKFISVTCLFLVFCIYYWKTKKEKGVTPCFAFLKSCTLLEKMSGAASKVAYAIRQWFLGNKTQIPKDPGSQAPIQPFQRSKGDDIYSFSHYLKTTYKTPGDEDFATLLSTGSWEKAFFYC